MFTRQPKAPSTNPVCRKKQASRGRYTVQKLQGREVALWASSLVEIHSHLGGSLTEIIKK